MLRSLVVLGLSVGVGLLACGGSVVPVDGTSSGSSGGSSGTTTSSGGISSGGTSGGGTSGGGGGPCVIETQPADRACVPGVAPANVPLTVQVDKQDGYLDCFRTLQPCRVDVAGSTITLAMQSLYCPPTGSDNGCAEPLEPPATCAIPPLAAGTYTVLVSGSGNTGFRPRTLVVSDTGPTASSCTLLPQGAPPPTIDLSKYSTSCSSDSDCTVVATGNACAQCGCNSGAIAASDKPRYDAEQRALGSECEPSFPAPCPLCPAASARCQIDPSALTGFCTIAGMP